MEGFSAGQPRSEVETGGLGIERVHDPEKAQLMASLENLAFEQAYAYQHFLEKPEPHTVEESIEFTAWKAFNYSPADIKILGQENAEIIGEKYDIEKDIQKFEAKKSRFGLVKAQIKAACSIAYNHAKFAARWTPALVGFSGPKNSNKVEEFRTCMKNFDLESHRFMVANEAVRNLGQTGRKEYTAQMLDEQARQALLEAEGYKLPHVSEDESMSDSDIQPEKDEINSEQQKTDSESTGEEGKANEAAEDTFDWVYEKYAEYLSMSEADKQQQSYFFRDLEARGTTLDDLKDQEKVLTQWLDRLKVYGKRMEDMTDAELEKEMRRSFLVSITKRIFEKRREESGSEILLDLGVALFKTYKASKEIEKRKKTQV